MGKHQFPGKQGKSRSKVFFWFALIPLALSTQANCQWLLAELSNHQSNRLIYGKR